MIPVHLKAAVKADLDRVVRLGILEKVYVNSPVRWLSRMIVTLKKDGSPRRIIDYKKKIMLFPVKPISRRSRFSVLRHVTLGKRKLFWTLKMDTILWY